MKQVWSNAEWRAEGLRLFGTRNAMEWEFRCPACGNVSTADEFEQLGALFTRAPSECVGRIRLEADKPIGGACTRVASDAPRLAGIIEVEAVNNGEMVFVFPFAVEG